jgi:GlpG protein
MSEQELRPLVSVKQHNIALLFCNYLQSIDVPAKVIASGDDFVIYCQADHLSHAQLEFEQFIANPYDAKYQQAAWHSGEVGAVSEHGPSLVSSFKEQFFAHAGVVTLVIFSVCWLAFIASNLGWAQPVFNSLNFYQQLDFANVLQAPHRLIGPAFFHFSWLHIVFNTMWWWQIGGAIEQTLGKNALISLLLVSAIVSNVGQFLVSGPNFGGLSGVVYALVGFVWWMGWLLPEKGLSLSKPIIGFLLFWLVLGFVNVLPVNMANTAHLLGLVSGCCLAYLRFLVAKKVGK